MKRYRVYKEFITKLGFSSGVKIIIMRWYSHFVSNKMVFSINSKMYGRVFLRINSSDMTLAKQILAGTGGEYEFVSSIRGVSDFRNIVDAGANIGLFSLVARKAAPKAFILAIEPDHSNASLYRRNITNNYMLVEGGVWSSDCKLEIMPRETMDVGYVVRESQSGTVDAFSMNTLMSKIEDERIDLLKIDIEGSEYEVFDGSENEWIDRVDRIIIETHDRIKDGCSKRVFESLLSKGFNHKNYGESEYFYRV